jgi:hypothetical protein
MYKPFPLSRLKGLKEKVEAVIEIYVSVLVFCRPIQAQSSKTTHQTTSPEHSSASEKGGMIGQVVSSSYLRLGFSLIFLVKMNFKVLTMTVTLESFS